MNGVMRTWGRDLSFRWDNNSTISSTYRSRNSSSIATITSSVHNLAPGDVVTLQAFGGTGYNHTMTTVVSVPSTTTFTFNSPGSGEPLTADNVGTIGIGVPVFGYQTNSAIGTRGQIYIQGPLGLVAGLYGGYWVNGTIAGSRISLWYYFVWSNFVIIGLRSRCDHIVVP
jgi:hypothetical protein